MSWVLVLEQGTGDPARKVAGLPLALRLGLDAQGAGASGVVLGGDLARLKPLFADPRFELPLLTELPGGVDRVVVGASCVVHRGLFKAIREAGVSQIDLRSERFEHAPPWGFEPFTVDDRASQRRAERALFRALRKPQDGWTSRYLNRYISLAISRWLVKTPLRPNQVSLGILAIGIAGAVIATRGGYWDLLLGAFLFQAQSVLDGCDGEMSRVTYRGSLLGEWLDTVGDDLTNYGFFAGSAWGLYSSSGHLLYLIAGVVTVVCGATASGLEYRYLYRIGSGDLLKYPLSQSTSSGEGLMAYIGPLFKRDTFVFLTLVAAVVGQVGPMLVVFCLGAVGILISVLSTELRLRRERSQT
ncbi:MAG: CDP-alcohol phosphatidyltransferase family protein [Myxococcales bacterium]|nr:CDP-alcohol phosphatidyltransferase family protein [Myxococcales bacterium]